MQAIILCGGLGTRLRSVIGERQKAMTDVNGEPFIVNIIKYLKTYGITDVIFSVGYKSDEVKNYFGDKYYFGMDISYANELEPLGTGGAIGNCLDFIKDDFVIVLNGDTIFPIEIDKLVDNYKKMNSDISIAVKVVNDGKRYGTIVFDDAVNNIVDINTGNLLIKSFNEKVDSKGNGKCYINGGIYVMSKKIIMDIPKNQKLSFENDLMPKWLSSGKRISGKVFNADFIDIGTPESLAEFKKRFD